jgi:hypothetical protein
MTLYDQGYHDAIANAIACFGGTLEWRWSSSASRTGSTGATVTEPPEDIERRIDGLLFIRHACKRDFSFKFLALATISLRTVNERLLQIDQEREAAAYVAEIRHNTIMLKAGIGLGLVESVIQAGVSQSLRA